MKRFEGCLLVSDMDATLLTSDHDVSDKNRRAIEYFISEGGYFTVATGRMVDAVRVYLDRLPVNAPAVLHNGAKLYDYSDDSVIFEKYIEEERKPAVKRVYNDMPELGLEIYSNEIIYVYKPCMETKRFLTRDYKVVYNMPDEVWEQPWTKLLLIGDTKEILDKYEPVYRSEYDKGFCVRSGPLYLDIVAGGVSKGRGARRVADMLGCKKIIAIGDSENDIDMLQDADISFAVENAVPDAKRAAMYGAPHHNESAVAYAVERLSGLL